MIAGSGFRRSTIRPNEINFLPRRGHSHVPKIRQLIKDSGNGKTLRIVKYASVRFRGKQMPVADRPGPVTSPGSVERWFADLTDRESEQLCVTSREEAAILR
jgi:hypothetical protein